MDPLTEATSVQKSLIAIVVAIHYGFAAAEMLFWPKIVHRLIPSIQQDQVPVTRRLAVNMGLYNAFLATGLLVALRDMTDPANEQFAILLLWFVVLAGLVGAVTASRKIFWFQSVPAIAALLSVYLDL